MKTRREFIKISALGVGGLAIAGGAFKLIKSINSTNEADKINPDFISKRFPTYCEVCFWKCAGWTYTDDKGKIWKIVGNEKDPHCNGRLCPRGTGGIGMHYDDERLKKPMIRTSERGKQVFKEVEWGEALDYVANKMKFIAEKYGAETMALFTHGSGGKYFGDLLKAYGSDSIAQPSYAQCRGPREAGFIATFGEGIHSPEPTDIRDCKCLVLIGSHIGENMHNGQVQEMSDAIDKGATIITVDPRFSTAASKSKFWLPIKPSTDMALLLSWMNVLINEGWYDKAYIEKHAIGFEQLKEHVKNYTPEWAYGITNIAPDVIRKTAKEMYNASPSVIVHPGRHVTWYGDDTQRSRAIAILNALLGSWGRRGGFYFPTKASLPKYHRPEFPKPKKTWREILADKYPLADTPVASAICDMSIPTKDWGFQYKGWIVNGTNLPLTLPNEENTFKAIQNLELLVAVDTMPMEITGWADVILPECTYLERYDSIRAEQHREAYIAVRVPASKPLYDNKSGYWIAKEIAKRLNLSDYFPFENLEDEIDWQLKQMGSSLAEMKKIGVKKIEKDAANIYIDETEKVEFNTDSGKIELYSTSLAAMGFDAAPVYTPHAEPPEGFYRLIYGRAPAHTFSRTANNPNLTDIMEENTLWINPKVAKNLQIENNQYVWLKNQHDKVSKFPIKVRVTERIRWDSVYMAHGFGHSQEKMKRCFGKGLNDTQLITNVKVDPMMGGTGMRENFVTILLEKPTEEATL